MLTTLLNSITMKPRALGVSSTLAFVEQKLLKWGSRGIAPACCLPLWGSEGVTFTNSTERF